MEAMVNVPAPFATDVDVDTLFFSDPAITVDFENVPMDKMTQVRKLKGRKKNGSTSFASLQFDPYFMAGEKKGIPE